MKIRVLNVVSGLNYGGIETFLKNMVEYLPREEFEISILCTSPQRGKLEGFFEQYCTIYHLRDDSSRRARQNCRKEFFLAHKNEFDIIHIHTVLCTVYSTAEIAKKYQNCKIIVHSHIASDYSFKTKIKNSLTRSKLNKNMDLAVGCSENSAIFLFGKKYGKNAVVLNNGIDVGKFAFDEGVRADKRKEFDISDDCFVMGTVARLSPQKNLGYLIDIFNCYHKLNGNSKLLIVGDGECKTDLEKKVGNLNLNDSVIFTGARSDIPDMLQALDCFMLPSLFEGLAISSVEAQASGLRCFISDTVTRDIDISKRNVFLSINEKPDVWADAVYNTDCDRTVNTQLLREAGFDIAYTASQMAEEYKRLVK